MPAAGEDGERAVVMAVIGGPHGVRGAVKLTVYADDPLALRRYNPFEVLDGRRLKLTSLRHIGKSVVAEIEGFSDRTAVEALRGLELSVPRRRLPRPDADEFYHVDLVGLEACLSDGTVLGRVTGVADHGAGDVIEVLGARPVVVPFTRAVVPVVDVAGGFLVVDPPPGLLDDVADEPLPQPEEDAGVPQADEEAGAAQPDEDASIPQADEDAASGQPDERSGSALPDERTGGAQTGQEAQPGGGEPTA